MRLVARRSLETRYKESAIAKRRKPRPTGPPPSRSPKLDRGEAAGANSPAKRKSGEPAPPSTRSVLKRAGFISAAYVLALVLLVHLNVIVAVLVGLLGMGIMVPMGMLLDRFRYRAALRKWEATRAGAK